MYKHILIPTDGSTLSTAAVEQAMSLAKSLGAKVTVLTVVAPFSTLGLSAYALDQVPNAATDYQQAVQAGAKRRLAEAEQQAQQFGVQCETVVVEHTQPYWAIIETANARGCDLIAMASHGQSGISALLLGSETTKVLTHSKLPVLVYR